MASVFWAIPTLVYAFYFNPPEVTYVDLLSDDIMSCNDQANFTDDEKRTLLDDLIAQGKSKDGSTEHIYANNPTLVGKLQEVENCKADAEFRRQDQDYAAQLLGRLLFVFLPPVGAALGIWLVIATAKWVKSGYEG